MSDIAFEQNSKFEKPRELIFLPIPSKEYPLLNHLNSSRTNLGVYPAYEMLVLNSFSNVNTDPNLTVQEDIIGLTGLAKTMLRWELTLRREKFGRVYTHDYEIAIKMAEKMGLVVNPSGSREPSEFEAANQVDNMILDLFFSYIPGKKFLTREKPAVTQDPFRKSGVTRGDWDFDHYSKHADVGVLLSNRVLFEIFLGGDEEFRRKNIWRRAELTKLASDSGWASPLPAAIQHLEAMICLVEDLLANKELPEGSIYYDYSSKNAFRELIIPLNRANTDQLGDVQEIMHVYRGILLPRIAKFVHHDYRSPKIIYLHNQEMQKWEEAFKNHSKLQLNKKYGIHRALMSWAEESGDSNLRRELMKLKVPEVIELENEEAKR